MKTCWATAALLAWAGSAWAAGTAEDRLCPQPAPAPPPVEAALPGCHEAWCTPVGDEQLCNCRPGRDPGSAWMAQRRAGSRVLQQWRAEVSPLMGPGAFEVSLAPLEGNGKPQWLVAQFLTQSNGLGVTHHRLCVLWPDQPGRSPLCRSAEEWRALTVLVQERGRSSCSLLDAGWQPGRDATNDAGRGQGTYAVGRLLHLEGARWAAVPGRAPVARRLLDDFMNEREQLPQRNAQALWYQHSRARETVCPGLLCRKP